MEAAVPLPSTKLELAKERALTSKATTLKRIKPNRYKSTPAAKIRMLAMLKAVASTSESGQVTAAL